MKATLEIPDDLYREVKAKSSREGRRVREVTVELFRQYVGPAVAAENAPRQAAEDAAPILIDGKPAPPWFGIARKYARQVQDHSLAAIRASIARGRATELGEKESRRENESK